MKIGQHVKVKLSKSRTRAAAVLVDRGNLVDVKVYDRPGPDRIITVPRGSIVVENGNGR